jgi:endonuclease III
VVRATILRFLEGFPTPSAVLTADPKLIKTAINPVGLQDVRCKALSSMSRDFLAEVWSAPTSSVCAVDIHAAVEVCGRSLFLCSIGHGKV